MTLLAPPPLGEPLDIDFQPDGRIEVTARDGVKIARARPIDAVDAEPPVRPSLAAAREASRRHPGHGREGLL